MSGLVNRLDGSRAAAAARKRVRGTPLETVLKRAYAALAIASWRLDRTGSPPPQHKIRELRRYGREYGLRMFVETGTFQGDTLAAVRSDFIHLWSVELSPELHTAAAERFAGDPGVDVLCGDSASVLPVILARLHEPTLFWLDAHYSEGETARGDKDTPIEEELHAILDHAVPGHVILIDDARHFVGRASYPTLDTLRRTVLSRDPSLTLEVRDDIVRIHPSTRRASG